MTKERKLAIQMWEEIKGKLPDWDSSRTTMAYWVKLFKCDFCVSHHLRWDNHCWFCTYFNEDCAKCPLCSCDHFNTNTAWARLVADRSTLETRIAACDEIIAALKRGKRK